MSAAERALNEWAEEVDRIIPPACTNCERGLSEIRYVTDMTRTHIRLTGATNEVAVHKALCPHCGHTLAESQAGERRYR